MRLLQCVLLIVASVSVSIGEPTTCDECEVKKNLMIQDIYKRTGALLSAVDEIVRALHGVHSDIDKLRGLPQCPDGWVFYKRLCYFFSVSPKSFYDAARSCSELGAHLAYIDSDDENNFIKNVTATMKGNGYWIGLSDEDEEGTWTLYGTKIPATYFDWKVGEPNQSGEEDCVHIWPIYSFKWNDEDCWYPYLFICEKGCDT